MLEIQHLSLTLKKDNRPLLRDFSFVLGPQDKAALIGEEGNGKSTLLQALCRRERVEAYCDVEGRVLTGSSPLGLPRPGNAGGGTPPASARLLRRGGRL